MQSPGATMAEASPEQQPTALVAGTTGVTGTTGPTAATGASDPDEDSPNMIVYRKVRRSLVPSRSTVIPVWSE